MGEHFGDASLLETLRHSSTDGFFLLEGHLRRLRASAAVLGGGRRVPDPETLCQALEAEARRWPTGEASRVRLLLAPVDDASVALAADTRYAWWFRYKYTATSQLSTRPRKCPQAALGTLRAVRPRRWPTGCAHCAARARRSPSRYSI